MPNQPTTTPQADRRRIIERIKSMRAEGMTFNRIAGILNEEGVPTVSRVGRWVSQSARRLTLKRFLEG